MKLESQSSRDHWSRHAKQWEFVKPPLRPGLVDVRSAQKMIRQGRESMISKPLHALLLGVTPELVQMDWPLDTYLRAVDRNQAMIDTVLPHNSRFEFEAICGDWLNLPIESQSVDCVLGDGCFTVIDSYDAQLALCRQVRRVLEPTGSFIIRLFVQPEEKETVNQVFEDLLNLSIGNFHIFKWRLAMALQTAHEQRVEVHSIWQTWHDKGICIKELSINTGWPVEEIRTIDAYREASAWYSFPTLTQMRELFSIDFNELECHVPEYEMGDRCPTLLLAPRE